MDFPHARRLTLAVVLSAIALSGIAGAANAQEPVDDSKGVNPDEMADQLNSQQQLQQTVTLNRSIDGVVVESDKRTITYERGAPYRETEAGKTALESLKAAFDGELLTRVEAFEEAKLYFTVADVDRNGEMTSEEFITLVNIWRESDDKKSQPQNQELARQRQYEAFLAEIDPDAADLQHEAHAAQKFAFLTGAAQTASREDYVREYLLDFDSMDADKDTLLKGPELLRFRALNRGETIEM